MKSLRKIGFLFLTAALLFGPALSNAQSTLPQGGESFSDAALLELGSYESGEDWIEQGRGGQTKYFYIEGVEPGQMIDIDAFVRDSDFEQSLEVGIYDGNREYLTKNRTLSKGEGFDVSWLTSSGEASDKYYLKLFCEHGNADFTIDVNLADRFDAGTGTDAGGKITEALDVDFGEHTGYISCSHGSDRSDYYKVTLKPGEKVTARLTPDVTFYGAVRVYNNLREELLDKKSGGYGAITEVVFEPEVGGDYYVEVYRDTCEERSGTTEYTLSLEKDDQATNGGSLITDGDGEDGENGGGGVGVGIVDGIRNTARKAVRFLIGLAVLVVILAVVVFALKKKKKKPSKKPEYEVESMPKQEPEAEQEV